MNTNRMRIKNNKIKINYQKIILIKKTNNKQMRIKLNKIKINNQKIK